MNKPVAWMYKTTYKNETEIDVISDEFKQSGKGGDCSEYSIPLYTHPVNTCKHGVDDGACKECYMESTHPVELTDEEIISTMVQFDVYSSDDHCLIEAGRAILKKASEK